MSWNEEAKNFPWKTSSLHDQIHSCGWGKFFWFSISQVYTSEKLSWDLREKFMRMYCNKKSVN
jgi:hypothetical protein